MNHGLEHNIIAKTLHDITRLKVVWQISQVNFEYIFRLKHIKVLKIVLRQINSLVDIELDIS